MQRKKLVYGIGVNDADYIVKPVINGKQVTCQFYAAWSHMIERCYSSKLHSRYPSYAGCSVVSEWHSFSAFREWMIDQDCDGVSLDKDLLFPGNKVYSPSTCVFITARLNSFTTDSARARGVWPIGVYFESRRVKFKAQCCNPFSGNTEHLGYFTCPESAHEAWRARKHEHALALAEQQTDPRLAKALSTRYLVSRP